MKNSLRARASQTAMRKPGGISEPPVTQAECAARGRRDSRVASPAPRAPPSAAPGAPGAEAPAGFPPPSHRQSQSPTATLGQALGWDLFLCPRAGLQRPLLIIFDLDSPAAWLWKRVALCVLRTPLPTPPGSAGLGIDSPNGTVSVRASVSPTEQQQQLQFLHTTPHPAPGWREY